MFNVPSLLAQSYEFGAGGSALTHVLLIVVIVAIVAGGLFMFFLSLLLMFGKWAWRGIKRMWTGEPSEPDEDEVPAPAPTPDSTPSAPASATTLATPAAVANDVNVLLEQAKAFKHRLADKRAALRAEQAKVDEAAAVLSPIPAATEGAVDAAQVAS